MDAESPYLTRAESITQGDEIELMSDIEGCQDKVRKPCSQDLVRRSRVVGEVGFGGGRSVASLFKDSAAHYDNTLHDSWQVRVLTQTRSHVS